MPPIHTLLESTDRGSAPAPAPAPPTPPAPTTTEETPRPPNPNIQAIEAREEELRTNIAQLQEQAERLEREAQSIQAGLVPADWEDWAEEDRQAWLAENGVPRYQSASELMTAIRARENGSPHQAPESLTRSDRPQSRDGRRQSTLPTPPHDESGDQDSLFIPSESNEAARRAGTTRRSHPLSHSWLPDSPINGLGDRNRSPTPADGWEIMRTTITPDATLPSADSSFTSAAASQSFTSNATSITETEHTNNSSENSQRNADDDESVSSFDPDDLVCSDEEREATAAFAAHMYYYEQNSAEGRARIARHHHDWLRDGNLYALLDEEEQHEIGFRIIDEALETEEGCARVDEVAQNLPAADVASLGEWIFRNRRERRRRRRTRSGHITDDEPPSPHPERYGSNVPAAVREASEAVHDYFRRFTAEEALTAHQRDLEADAPPRYEPRDERRAVSPPSARSERDVAEALLSGDEHDLGAMRRIVERLAQRDDVPDEWWMSMGLNLSRTRARSRSRTSSPQRQARQLAASPAAGGRVRTGRVDRERNTGSRL